MFKVKESVVSKITEYDIIKDETYFIENIKNNEYLFIRGIKGSYNKKYFISLQEYRKLKLDRICLSQEIE